MSLSSDISINLSRFDLANVPPVQAEFNKWLDAALQSNPKWYQIGAPAYRKMRSEGKARAPSLPRSIRSIKHRARMLGGLFTKDVVLDQGKNFTIPSREPGREIPCRLMLPSDGQPVKGVFLHIHGGGWVLQNHSSDTHLLQLANSASLAVVSVGYRVAPENPHPAGPEDCYDAADHLIKTSQSTYHAPLRFIGGDSAGAHFSILTTIHVLSQHPSHHLSGIVLNFGLYDLSSPPRVSDSGLPLVLPPDIYDAFVHALVPAARDKPELLKDPAISPFYADLSKFKKLPPALFVVGTADGLVEDSMFMATRWMVNGGEAITRIFPGAPQGFTSFPYDKCPAAEEAAAVTKAFLLEKVK